MQPTGFSGGTLYFAYGANLCRAHMALWCPEAVPLVRAVLPGHRLVFRPWADVLPAPGHSVPGALYEVSAGDLAALDTFEEYPTLYERLHTRVHSDRCPFDAMAYRMTPGHDVCLPDADYLNLILQGYADWNLDAAPLASLATRLRQDADDWTPDGALDDDPDDTGRGNAWA